MIVSIVMIIASIGIVRRALASRTPTVNEALRYMPILKWLPLEENKDEF